jgi:hypothetical protein
MDQPTALVVCFLSLFRRETATWCSRRELFVVPAAPGTVRRPIPKPRRCCCEPGTVINTGDADADLTAEVEELA